MIRIQQKHRILVLLLVICLLCTGCGDSTGSGNKPSGGNPTTGDGVGSSGSGSASASDQKGSWDNSPKVLLPSADNTASYSGNGVTIDVSNSSEGYVMVEYTGSASRAKLQITGPDGITYTYDKGTGYEVFPFSSESGQYKIVVYECTNPENNKYAAAFSQEADISITNEFGPFLYPNQYVNFTADSLAVEKGAELAYSANCDLDVVTNVYNYIIDTFTYDYDKAKTVPSGYLPDVDEIYRLQTGICFDYAAVMAAMLRSQGIPTRLEVGYKGEEYHAWISTHIENVGWVNGIIEFNGTTWNLMDPTFASTSKKPKKFIADNSDYLTKYVY